MANFFMIGNSQYKNVISQWSFFYKEDNWLTNLMIRNQEDNHAHFYFQSYQVKITRKFTLVNNEPSIHIYNVTDQYSAIMLLSHYQNQSLWIKMKKKNNSIVEKL